MKYVKNQTLSLQKNRLMFLQTITPCRQGYMGGRLYQGKYCFLVFKGVGII